MSKLTKFQLEEAREWLKDCSFPDADDDDIDEATDIEIERVVRRCWEGGIDDFIQMCDHTGDYDDGWNDLTEKDELIATYGLSNYEFVAERDWVDDSLDHYSGDAWDKFNGTYAPEFNIYFED